MSEMITGLGTQRIPKGPIEIVEIRVKKRSPNTSVLYIRDRRGNEFDVLFEHTLHLFASTVMAALAYFGDRHGVVEVHRLGRGQTEVRCANAKKDGLTKA